MSSPIVPDRDDERWTKRGGIFVRRNEGITKWVAGDTFTVKITANETNGSLGLMEATVPPGSGPVAHAHGVEDEAFYMLGGELEFLNGDQTFIAEPGDLIFIPRGTRHRYKNIGLHHATMLTLLTPGGHELTFAKDGMEPEPGKPAPPPWTPEITADLGDYLELHHITLLPEDRD